MTSSIRYNEPLPSFTLDASDAPPFIAPRPRRTGLIIGIIIAVVIVIIIIVVVIVLVLRSRARRPTTPGGGSGTPTGITCTADAQCLAPKVCNTSTQRCVDCTSSTQCANSAFPFCRAETNTCVRCLTTTDCGGAANTTCSNNVCCDSTPPVINSVTSTVSGDTRIQINLDIKQPVATSRVFAILEDPTGFPLLTRTCSEVTGQGPSASCSATVACPAGTTCVDGKCVVPSCVSFAAGSFVSLVSSNIGIPLVTGASYRVRVKVVYNCGAIRNASTAFSAPFPFTIGNCPTNPNQRLISSIQDAFFAGLFDGVVITFPVPNGTPSDPEPNFLVGIIASKIENFHPNRAEYLVASTMTQDGPNGFKVVVIPYPPSRFGVWYYRVFNVGQPGECTGPVSPAVRFQSLLFT